ncbi:hypothetical protein LZ30DRAFT_265969 [Colletotrichum cereale]|nr:hypothetical protein LZ30DRAFT_265969 [Colletotrichum cereale]
MTFTLEPKTDREPWTTDDRLANNGGRGVDNTTIPHLAAVSSHSRPKPTAPRPPDTLSDETWPNDGPDGHYRWNRKLSWRAFPVSHPAFANEMFGSQRNAKECRYSASARKRGQANGIGRANSQTVQLSDESMTTRVYLDSPGFWGRSGENDD